MAKDLKTTAEEPFERWKREAEEDLSATTEQRDKANEEIRFVTVAGGQWEGWLQDDFEDRAKLEFDQVSEYYWRTYGQWTENRVSVNYAPDDDASTDEDADLLDGLFRRDLRRNNGQAAIDMAVREAMGGGFGAFVFNTEYEDEEDPDNEDQCVVISDLANAYATVIFDSASKRIDKRDAERCTVLIPHSKEGFKRKYPDAQGVSVALKPQDRRALNWSTPQLVYEAIRYEVRVEERTCHTFGNPLSEDVQRLYEEDYENKADFKADVRELTDSGYELLSAKKIKKRNVYRSKFCGSCQLEEERRIAGKFIPVIPVFGYWSHNDGVDHFHGVIRKKMDPQRLMNMVVSVTAETTANAAEDKPIFDPEQMPAGIQSVWKKARHRVPYLLAKALRDPKTGAVVHNGPIGMAQGATMAPAAQALLTVCGELIMRSTGGAPQDTLDTDASGKAINAVLKRVDLTTKPIFDNIAAAMRHAGEVYRWIAAEVYAERSRSINVVTQDGKMQRRQLLQREVRAGQLVYANDPSRGKFEVIVDTGPNFQTQREEAIVALKDIVQTLQPQDPMQRLLIMRLVEMLPSQGLDDIKDYIRRQLLVAGIRKPETEEDMAVLDQLSQAQANQGPDPQSQLLEAAADQQRSEAALNVAKIGDLQASGVQKRAAAILDLAKARQIRNEITGKPLKRALLARPHDDQRAVKSLRVAIARHERHMAGTEPTTGPDGERSQKKMMDEMRDALAELEGGGSRPPMKMNM